MADYKLWNALKDAKKYRWVELSHSLNNDSPYWSGIPDGSVELAKTVGTGASRSWNASSRPSNSPASSAPTLTFRATLSRTGRCRSSTT